ncbi:MAG: LysR family transcriptional regulator [Acetobacter sp.]|nr:LysR family transcriptional regulator [Acetobacter sp.]
MELTQLLQFKTIAECKTMTEAAERLHISQPALSFSLKKLEYELGTQLFERAKNKIILNKAGEMAFTYACAILGQAEEMKNAFRQYTKENNVLSLGFCDAGPMRFSLPLLQKTYSDLNLSAEIMSDDTGALNDLLSKKYDAVISLEKLEHQDVISIPFAKEALMLSVSVNDELAQEKTIRLNPQIQREIALYRIYGAYERKIHPFLKWLEQLPNTTTYTDYFVFRQMLEHKKLLTFTTRLVQLYRNDGDRIIIPLENEGVTATYWISYERNNKKRLAPIITWQQENMLILLGSENPDYK